MHSEVMLPENAPEEYADPSVLWNSVEMREKNNSNVNEQADLLVTLFRLPGRSGASGDPGGDGFLRVVYAQGFHPGKPFLIGGPAGNVPAPLDLVSFPLQAEQQIFKVCGGGNEPVDGCFQLRLVAGPGLGRLMLNDLFFEVYWHLCFCVLYCIYINSTVGGEYLEIIVSNKASKPLYEQIASQIKAAIISGELSAGEPIPSMRALAKSLHISVLTVQKAYETLQDDGFIETTAGKGCYVSAQNQDFYLEEQQKKIEEKFSEAIEIARSSGISLEKLIGLLTVLYQEDD